MTTATQPTPIMTEVEFHLIRPNPWQPRAGMEPDYLRELQESLLAVGLLQEPLARPIVGGYQLAFGHTRVAALRDLSEQGVWGPTVRLKVQDLADEEMAIVALAENRSRKNLTPAEEIAAWAKVLREIPGFSIQSLADKIGVDRTTMSKHLSILDLPRSVLDLVDAGKLGVGAAQEILALRNDHHCHDDAIEMVLHDVGGESRYEANSRPADYRIKTIRASIRGIATGRSAHGFFGAGDVDPSRTWRPLFSGGQHGREISFDVDEFRGAHPNHVHFLPEGEIKGGLEWTCDAKAWGTWATRATREANKGAGADGSAPAKAKAKGGSNAAEEWWKAVKKDPVVREVVGTRLRAMTSVKGLTPMDIAALGSRVQRPPDRSFTELPQEAQPPGVRLRDANRGQRPPEFHFEGCRTCVIGASWVVPEEWKGENPHMVCVNQQHWLDVMSVGMQKWLEGKETQAFLDHHEDLQAIRRLNQLAPTDARALVSAMWHWFREPKPVEPLTRYQVGYDQSAKYHYWPAGAEEFCRVAGLELPDAKRTNDWSSNHAWEQRAEQWFREDPDNVDWSLALACLQVWQARRNAGLGDDIWGAGGIPTGVQAGE